VRLFFAGLAQAHARTETETILGLALQRVYYRGTHWARNEKCSDPDCPHLEAVQHFVRLAREALTPTGLDRSVLGRVGLIPLRAAVDDTAGDARNEAERRCPMARLPGEPAERLADYFVTYLFDQYKGSRHVRRVASWVGLVILGIEKVVGQDWQIPRSRQLEFDVALV
jgi:hypothetical protein